MLSITCSRSRGRRRFKLAIRGNGTKQWKTVLFDDRVQAGYPAAEQR
jgi:hypothetical protein